MNYYLSVDGGGTKTDFLLESEDRSVSVRLQSGAASIKSVGEDAVRQNISAGLNALWQRAGIQLEQVRHAVFGMSGCDCAQDEARLHKLLQSLGWKPEQYTLCNDAVLGFYAAADPPGLVLIAGTGSIVLGVDARGAVTRSGGWGYGFSDQGSGYWLGCRALEQALLYCDGCGPYAPWFEEVARALNTPLDQLPQTATALEGCDEVASLAALVLNWPEAEPLREEILTQGAAHLARLIQAGHQKLHLAPDAPFRLVFAGGCLRNPAYAARVENNLPEPLRAARVRGNGSAPVFGGMRLARKAGI